MRRRTAVFAVLLFFALAPAVLIFCILSATGNFSEGQTGMILALCALVLLVFSLLTPIAAGLLCRRFSCAPQVSPSMDSLTGLLCRTAAEEQARAVLSAPPEGACALILADIQSLGAVNESLGYDGGDHLLRALADTLRPLFAGRCVSGRIAHDTFLVFVSLPPAQAEKMLLAELQALQEQWPRLLTDLDASLCGTVKLALGAAWSPRGATFETLYSGADRALLQTRRDGTPYQIQEQI